MLIIAYFLYIAFAIKEEVWSVAYDEDTMAFLGRGGGKTFPNLSDFSSVASVSIIAGEKVKKGLVMSGLRPSRCCIFNHRMSRTQTLVQRIKIKKPDKLIKP